MYCNEYFDFVKAGATLDSSQQLFEYVFRVKRPFPRPCIVFEHFTKGDEFFPCGAFPPVPTTQWNLGIYVHRTRQFLPEGEYDWWAGMVDGETRERFEVGSDREGRIALGRIRVGPLALSAASELVRSQRTVLPFLHRDRLPVYISKEGQVVARPERGDNPNKAAVISIPKAGTYLAERLLREFGFQNCSLHLSLGHFEDYRNATIDEADQVRHFIRAHHTTQLVTPGQSIVGHIRPCLESRVALADFRRFFLYRNLRDAITSCVRVSFRKNWSAAAVEGGRESLDPELFSTILGRIGPRLRDEFANVLGWRDEADILPVQFEELMGDFGADRQHACVAAIAARVGCKISLGDIPAVLSRVIGDDTMTYSGKRSDWRQCWSEEIERQFADLGIRELNERLGYECPRPLWKLWRPVAAVRERVEALIRVA